MNNFITRDFVEPPRDQIIEFDFSIGIVDRLLFNIRLFRAVSQREPVGSESGDDGWRRSVAQSQRVTLVPLHYDDIWRNQWH